ncbi:UDP-N-acetylmuramoyl-L-alanyl-D-glutamate--2,6-diaminopimelate ligase [Streptomyces sp. CB03911]|uniref:UDP-N-acetylmuramoyl-L-alanyl-D-glutamate--2, 6-diaminopimelate ligase n=1 Tax=Streptomyces sp. CB03911 TaxID=1804758 RepID=UPI00093D2E02|nr:UDP-N-acetylmuramoyl-L-alanyl-D-glutamate--2,6-diaminopimelate ligase [Streptomyces sp. CB03911]OKI20910.1 UDP-N-acetylmuramyl peptide synthase [Streptomyces sp. CB03911]
MKLSDLLAGHPYTVLRGDPALEVTGGLSDSSADAGERWLFVAVPGRRADGHDHLHRAAAAGAVAALVSRTPADLPEGMCVVRVEDTRVAASLAAARWFGEPGRAMDVVAVTGTNGKTSVAAMIESVVTELTSAPVGVIGTGGPRLGGRPVPLATSTPTTPQPVDLQRILAHLRDGRARTVVMEVSSMALAQHRTDHVFARTAVFTNLSPDHLDDHGTMAAYKQAKLRLFAGLCERAVVNADDPVAAEILTLMPAALTYGIDAPAHYRATDVVVTPAGSAFRLQHGGRTHRARVPVPGLFGVYNALAAVAACHQLGHAVPDILRALERLPQIPGRFETITTPAGATVVVDYAHSTDSLEKALATVRGFATARVITVFGCGGDRDATKRAPMGAIAGRYSDLVVLTSDNPRSEDPEAILDAITEGLRGTDAAHERITDRRQAIAHALEHAGPGDIVLVAGKGSETYQLIGDRVLPFEDMRVVRELTAR